MRVLQVNDKLSMDGSSPSSVAHLLSGWIRRLEEREVYCSVCTFRDPDPGADYLEERGIPVRRMGYGQLSPRRFTALASFARDEDAQILHLHGLGASNFGRIVSRALGVPNVIHEHATLPLPIRQRIADSVLRGLTDVAVGVSGSVAEYLEKERYVPRDRIHVVPNGIDLNRFDRQSGEVTGALRGELNIPDEHALVGTVTRLRAEKGTEYLIRAVPQVLERVDATTFVIAGDGPLRDNLMATAESLGVSSSVRFLGFRDDIPLLLASLDVLVIPSLTEGFPLSLVEAMAAGCAIVATRVGGIPEIAEHGTTALLVPPASPESLATGIMELLNKHELRNDLSDQAAAKARDWTVSASADRLFKIYVELLGGVV